MRYRRLGSSGLKVSVVAIGSWLTYGHTVDDATSKACLDRAFEEGVNFIDTADVYARGKCEETLGRLLADRRRDSYVLATKVFFPMGSGPNDRGLSRSHVTASIEASLSRLRTDYVDLYQCHRWDPDTPVREVVRTMDDLIRRGLIRYWGVSMWPATRIMEAVLVARLLGAEPPVCNQPRYNLIHREIEDEVLPVSRELGLSQVVYSPLAQGILTGKYRGGRMPPGSRAATEGANEFILRHLDETSAAVADRLAAIARAVGATPAQLALAWCLRDEGIASVIVGATRPEQVAENIRAADFTLEPEVSGALDGLLDDGH